MLVFLAQLSGINMYSIYVYSMVNNILVETDGKFPITPVMGGFLLSAANFVFAIIMSAVVPKFGRKTLAVLGCLGMMFCNISAGACLSEKWYMAAFVSMVMFMGFFCLPGNVIFIYVSEVTVD